MTDLDILGRRFRLAGLSTDGGCRHSTGRQFRLVRPAALHPPCRLASDAGRAVGANDRHLTSNHSDCTFVPRRRQTMLFALNGGLTGTLFYDRPEALLITTPIYDLAVANGGLGRVRGGRLCRRAAAGKADGHTAQFLVRRGPIPCLVNRGDLCGSVSTSRLRHGRAMVSLPRLHSVTVCGAQGGLAGPQDTAVTGIRLVITHRLAAVDVGACGYLAPRTRALSTRGRAVTSTARSSGR